MTISIRFFDDEYADAALGALCKKFRAANFRKAGQSEAADICIDRYHTVSELSEIISREFAPDAAMSIHPAGECRLISVSSASGGSGSSSVCRLLRLGLSQLLEKKTEIVNFSVFEGENGFNRLLCASFDEIRALVESRASASDILAADIPPYHTAWESIISASDVVILNKGFKNPDSPLHAYLETEIRRLNPDAQIIAMRLDYDEFIDTDDMSCQTGRQVYEIIKRIEI